MWNRLIKVSRFSELRFNKDNLLPTLLAISLKK